MCRYCYFYIAHCFLRYQLNILLSLTMYHFNFPHVLLLHILYIHIQTLNHIKCAFKPNTIPYLYFPLVMLLIILYIELHILKSINCTINCDIVPYLYFPKCYITKYSVYTPTDFEIYVNSITNCNIVPYLYFPNVMLLIILYTKY
jgi:hypothetical protein